MAWERLKTDYKDAVWSGLRKFIPIDNGDGSYSVKDVTQYTVYDESFFGAYDANRINTAVNAIMAALENGTDLYEVFTEFFENQKVEFDKRANLDLDSFNIFLDNLQATANADVVQLKKDYTSEMTTFENNQEILFNQWFSMIKDQLSADAAGKLQNEINDVETHIRNLAVKIHFNDTVGTAAAITVQNVTSGNKYTVTDYTQPLYLTEAGEYTISIANDNYIVATKTLSISNADLMTHKTFRIMDGNGLAFVDGFVGAYVNK